MDVGRICRRDPVSIDAKATLCKAAQLMRERHVGMLVATEGDVPETARVVGVLTDRDIVTAVVAREADPKGLTVQDVMTRSPLLAEETQAVEVAVRFMRELGVHRVPVVDQGRVTGVLSLDDAIVAIADELRDIAEAIRGGHKRERVARP